MFFLLPLPSVTAEMSSPSEHHLTIYAFIEHLLSDCKGIQTENTVPAHEKGDKESITRLCVNMTEEEGAVRA